MTDALSVVVNLAVFSEIRMEHLNYAYEGQAALQLIDSHHCFAERSVPTTIFSLDSYIDTV